MLSLSGHKIHAQKGIGALYVRKGIILPNLIHGGGQERGRRAGTENVPAIVGLGTAIEAATRNIAEKAAVITPRRNRLIDGILKLAPNRFKSCDMIRVVGSNVKIHGKGSIMGDRHTHTGSQGEWGMGIRTDGASDVTVSGITIADCWGDCIYIGGGSKNIRISNCLLRGSRRQGISITKAENVTISNCKISDISGTMPQYAICIEPNKRCIVDNVVIENVTVTGCEGGFRAVLGKSTFDNARIGKVEIRSCHVSAKSRHTIHFAGCEQAVVTNCVIETRQGEKPILTRLVGRLTQKANKVVYTKTR
jgi:parallel beta-helix repeat protein